MNSKIIENENEYKLNKQFTWNKINDDEKNFEEKIVKLNELINNNYEKANLELSHLKSFQNEQSNEITNCREIKNKIKLKTLESI